MEAHLIDRTLDRMLQARRLPPEYWESLAQEGVTLLTWWLCPECGPDLLQQVYDNGSSRRRCRSCGWSSA